MHNSLVPTATEMEFSFLAIVHCIQQSAFADEIAKLDKSIVLKTSYQKLTPFLCPYQNGKRKLRPTSAREHVHTASLADKRSPSLQCNSETLCSLFQATWEQAIRNQRSGLLWSNTCHVRNSWQSACEDVQANFNASRDAITASAAAKGVTFSLIPPRAPHFGGLWEAAVKSAKSLMVKAVGSALLRQDELATVLVEVEAILNSRPIVADSSNPNDGEAIAPAHLLQRFWIDWSKDYLLSLQQRQKWATDQPNLEVGAVLVVHDDNAPPQQWMLGVVEKTVRSADGKVRVASVRTKTGTFKRVIHRLAPLPVE
ncbi:hypothetical protein ACLKA6_002568 [Drosophila palustris]